MPPINESLLEERLAALEKSRPWSPRSISRLESLIRSGDDAALFRINPLTFSAEKGIGEAEAIDLFLRAARAGLFDMEWHLLCPQCSQYVESFAALKHVQSHYRCLTCHEEGSASLDDYIQISFTVSSAVRKIEHHRPETLPIEDYIYKYRWSRGATMPDGSPFLDLLRQVFRITTYLEPGERRSFEVDLVPGVVSGCDLIGRAEFMMTVGGGASTAPKRREVVIEGGKAEPGSCEISTGRVTLEFHNRGSTRAAVVAANIPQAYLNGPSAPLRFPPFLTGKRLFLTQTFHDLFASETVKGTTGLGVKSITMLFTDLKGSTELYDRIGDLQAFALVQEHFERLGRVVRANAGVLVKTIGDAVMASFVHPADAVKAAVAMLQDIDQFNHEHGKREIILKIGIHTGASIAVTLNERLDYFGQTVNIAARVQGLADADEIYVTDEVYSFPGVQDLLRGFKVQPREAQLKGIQRGMRVHRVAFDRPTVLMR